MTEKGSTIHVVDELHQHALQVSAAEDPSIWPNASRLTVRTHCSDTQLRPKELALRQQPRVLERKLGLSATTA